VCGWCKDKFGLWWQIVPKQLGEVKGDPDSKKPQRVMPSHAQDAEDYVAVPQEAYDGK
jgi:predicted 3-demethylubiquinone-9 3-methyltransferase (glyoxalase superfamily)